MGPSDAKKNKVTPAIHSARYLRYALRSQVLLIFFRCVPLRNYFNALIAFLLNTFTIICFLVCLNKNCLELFVYKLI